MSIRSGYYGLFRPPYEHGKEYNSSIYIVSNTDKSIILLIPLVPNFFNDAYNIVRTSACNTVYLATPSTDILFISDIYHLYYEVFNTLQKDFILFTRDKIPFSVTDEFMNHVETGERHIARINSKINDYTDPIVEFSEINTAIARDGYDISVWTGQKKIYFANYISIRKLTTLAQNHEYLFDEIHMPYITNLYGGLTYKEVSTISSSPFLRKLRVHSFSTYDELNYALNNGAISGGVIE
jgi:hypothetical protein